MARKPNPKFEALKVITNNKDTFFFMGTLHNNTHYYQQFQTKNNIGTNDFNKFIDWVKRADKHWKEGETESLHIDCRVNHWKNNQLFDKKITYLFVINDKGYFEFSSASYCTFDEYNTEVGEHKLIGVIKHHTKDINEIIEFLH